MAEVILFDVNETLLDTAALDPWFEEAFGDRGARQRWFMELEILWLVTIATGQYRNFPTLARAALEMREQKEGATLPRSAGDALIQQLTTLPPHDDAAPALERLRDAGLRLAALTNGTLEAARNQLGEAGLADYFEDVFSADEVARFKPAPEPYAMAVERLGVDPGDARMVAAHAWDIAGAHAAGLRTAFVARPGKVPNPAGPQPDLDAEDLGALADDIIAEDG